MKYAVLGTGALGGYYGSKLAQAGKEVHFLLHSDYEYVKQNGLQIDSIKGNFHLNINAYDDTSKMPVCDVILICLKTTHNPILKNILPPIIHKDTIIILIQNGLGMEEDLHKDFPQANIAGAIAYICSNKTGPGHISHLDLGSIVIGSYSCKDAGIFKNICKDFNEAGVGASFVEDLNSMRWQKLVWNIPYNGMTVVLNTTTDRLMENPSTKELLYQMMLEVIRTANGLLIKKAIPESYALDMIRMTENMTPYSPSMKLDYDFHRPLEINYIYSRPLEVAKKRGMEMPMVLMLEKQLKFIEAKEFGK